MHPPLEKDSKVLPSALVFLLVNGIRGVSQKVKTGQGAE